MLGKAIAEQLTKGSPEGVTVDISAEDGVLRAGNGQDKGVGLGVEGGNIAHGLAGEFHSVRGVFQRVLKGIGLILVVCFLFRRTQRVAPPIIGLHFLQRALFHPDASGPGKELRGVPPAQLQPQLIYPAAAGGGGGDEASDDPPVFADGYQGNDVISAALEADVTLAAAGLL